MFSISTLGGLNLPRERWDEPLFNRPLQVVGEFQMDVSRIEAVISGLNRDEILSKSNEPCIALADDPGKAVQASHIRHNDDPRLPEGDDGILQSISKSPRGSPGPGPGSGCRSGFS